MPPAFVPNLIETKHFLGKFIKYCNVIHTFIPLFSSSYLFVPRFRLIWNVIIIFIILINFWLLGCIRRYQVWFGSNISTYLYLSSFVYPFYFVSSLYLHVTARMNKWLCATPHFVVIDVCINCLMIWLS